jgi:sorting nexin-8
MIATPDLPVPSVSLPKSSKPDPRANEQPAPAQTLQDFTTPQLQTQPMSQPPAHETRTAEGSRAPTREQSFGDPEADPWASPDMHRGHNHSNYTSVPPQMNGAPPPAATRTTSQFTTTSQTANTVTPTEPGLPPPSSLPSEGGWGGYNGESGDGFSAPALGAQGFGALTSTGGGSNTPAGLGRSIGRGRAASRGVEEVVTITSIAEKEGVFMFQHRNYEVASARRNSKVVRRYSDFVWLLDCLHKRYPVRQLPLLPPKRVASEYPSRCCLDDN